jgi:hypothetical protein
MTAFVLIAFVTTAAVPEPVLDPRLMPSALTAPPLLPIQDIPEPPFFARSYVWVIAGTLSAALSLLGGVMLYRAAFPFSTHPAG